MSKLTVEDLVKAQQDTITRLDFIANRIDAIAMQKTPKHKSTIITALWGIFGFGLFLLSTTNPVGPQAFSGLCLFILVWVMLGKIEGSSAIQDEIDRKNYEDGAKKLKEALKNSVGLNAKAPD
jgi:hypothetical protein